MAKGSQQQAPTQTTTAQLSPEQQSLLSAVMPQLQQFAATPLKNYSGETVAGFTAPQTQGQQMALDAAGAQGQTASQAGNTAGFYLGGDIWNPSTNPNLQGAIKAATDPLYTRLNEQLLPSIRQDSITTGGFGGSRQGIAEGAAIRDTQNAAANTASTIAQNQYDTNVRAQLQALGLAPTVQQTQVQPALTTSGVGDVQQNLAQQRLDAAQQNYWVDQLLPLIQGQAIAGIVGGLPGGSTVATGSVPQSNPTSAKNILGSAASGAALGSAILPGIGTGIGAAGGALLPFLFG